MQWRKWNNILHRDIGYLAFGLTIIYAVSGVAVNHVADWNPSYHIEESSTNIGAVAGDGVITEATVREVLSRLGETGKFKNSYLADPHTLQIFMEDNNITVNLQSGDVTQQKVNSRAVLREMNFLHLNHPKKIWTWFADLYAVALAFLAITGLFVLKGRKGITGRGAWLTTVGIVIPVVFLWLYL
ncbi:MAG: PepSY-associated TM helix domain-containing protein [bacterium]